MVLPVSDQRIQGVCLLVDDNKLDLQTNLHTEADFGEGCVPIGRQFGLFCVKPSLPFKKIKGFFVAPEIGSVVKVLLLVELKIQNSRELQIWYDGFLGNLSLIVLYLFAIYN